MAGNTAIDEAKERPSAFDRIIFEPGKAGGRACIRDPRVTVGLVVSLVADGASWDKILNDYPYLENEDIRQALAYAAWLAREEAHAAAAAMSDRTPFPALKTMNRCLQVFIVRRCMT
jgi:uncharacterized protein (DUF433 family)